MIAKLVGSQNAKAESITPIVNDFDFIQIIGTRIAKDVVQTTDSILISNGFSGEIIVELPIGVSSIGSFQILSISSTEIKFMNTSGLSDFGYINYYKYV